MGGQPPWAQKPRGAGLVIFIRARLGKSYQRHIPHSAEEPVGPGGVQRKATPVALRSLHT